MDAEEAKQDAADLHWVLDQWKRRAWDRDPSKMGDVLNELIARRGYLQALSNQELVAAWEEVVGAELARDSRPGKVRAGVLEVIVADSTVLQELAFRKADLARQLTRVAPQFKIRNVRFKVGSLN